MTKRSTLIGLVAATAAVLAVAGCDLLFGPALEGRPPRLELEVSRFTADTLLFGTGIATDDYGVDRVLVRKQDRVTEVSVERGRVVRFQFSLRTGGAGDSVTIEAFDGAGNVGRETISAPRRDTLPPTIRLLPPSETAVWTRDSVRIHAAAEDGMSGVAAIEIRVPERDFTSSGGPGRLLSVHQGPDLDTTFVPEKVQVFILARDSCGNADWLETRVFQDRTPPHLSHVYAPALLGGDTARFFVSAEDETDSYWPGKIDQFRLRLGDGSTLRWPDDPEWTVDGGRAVATADVRELPPIVDLTAVDAAGNTTTATTQTTGDVELVTVDAGEGFTCGADRSGSVYCWGANEVGQLGRETDVPAGFPGPIATTLSFSSVSAGMNHACALTPEGAAYCWGDNGRGQLGDGTRIDRLEPVSVAGGHVFARLDAAVQRTCGVTPDNEAYCWGRNERGQLGIGTSVDALTPTPLATDQRFVSVSGGTSALHSCGLTSGGAAYCWGADLAEGDALVPAAMVPNRTFTWIAPYGDSLTVAYEITDSLRWWDRPEWPPDNPGQAWHLPGLAPPFTTGWDLLCEARPADVPKCAQWFGWFREVSVPEGRPDEGFLFGAHQQTLSVGSDHACGIGADGSTYCVGANDRLQLGIEPRVYSADGAAGSEDP